MTATIRAAIVDDDSIVRSAVTSYLATADDIEIVATGQDGIEAVDLVKKHHIDVLVMDIRMPNMDGIDATAEVRRIAPHTHVLLLTSIDGVDEVRRGLAAGATGYLVKDSSPATVVEGVRAVHSDVSVVTPSTLARVMATESRPAPVVNTDIELSARETEVLHLLARGMSNSEIAATAFLSESTVKTYVSGIMTKLDAPSRLKAVVRAYELGLVSSE